MDDFVHHETIRLSEVDAAGIIYFSRIFELCHRAFEDWLAHQGFPMTASGMAGSDWLLPVVHAEADYRTPLRLGDGVTVAVQVETKGQSSITFGFRVTRADGELVAAVKHAHVAIDAATFRSRPLPEAFLRQILGDPS